MRIAIRSIQITAVARVILCAIPRVPESVAKLRKVAIKVASMMSDRVRAGR
jgi:hypothetical protein